MEAQKTVLKRYGLAEFVTARVPVLLLEVGADAGLGASGSFRYGVLKTGVTLKAGAGERRVGAAPSIQAPPPKALEGFFKSLAFPADMAVAPAPGGSRSSNTAATSSSAPQSTPGWRSRERPRRSCTT